jgi:hypothetical protein
MDPSDIGIQSKKFAKYYVRLVEDLQAEGVPENVARDEARMTAVYMLYEPAEEGDTCPLCGK